MYSFGTDGYIEEIVKKYSPAMLRAAYAVLKNTQDAEDAVQEAFLKLLQKRPSFTDEEHEKAWLLRVTLNISKNMLRRASREVCTDGIAPAGNTDAENVSVLGAVLRLPRRYRTVIHLYYYEGYRIKEIAAILNIPAASVGTLLSRGRKKLETILKGADES